MPAGSVAPCWTLSSPSRCLKGTRSGAATTWWWSRITPGRQRAPPSGPSACSRRSSAASRLASRSSTRSTQRPATRRGTLAGAPEGGALRFDHGAQVAAVEVVVHQAHRLHERVGGGWADERPAAAAQVLAHRLGLAALAEPHQGGIVEDRGPRTGVGFVPPHVRGEAAEFAAQLDAAAGIVDGRLDLGPVAHDPGVAEEPVDAPGIEARHRVDVEALER